MKDQIEIMLSFAMSLLKSLVWYIVYNIATYLQVEM